MREEKRGGRGNRQFHHHLTKVEKWSPVVAGQLAQLVSSVTGSTSSEPQQKERKEKHKLTSNKKRSSYQRGGSTTKRRGILYPKGGTLLRSRFALGFDLIFRQFRRVEPRLGFRRARPPTSLLALPLVELLLLPAHLVYSERAHTDSVS